MPRRRKSNSNSHARSAKFNWTWFTISNPLEPFKAIDWFIVRRAVTVTTWLAIIGGVTGLWFWGVPKLQAFASGKEAGRAVFWGRMAPGRRGRGHGMAAAQ